MDYTAAKTYIVNKLRNELSTQLTYHGLHHTLDVLKIAIELSQREGIDPEETTLVKTAALYHDSGFTISNKEHEKLGCKIARESLSGFGYSNDQIEQICGMIMATKIPQSPKNKLEEIICDADLDYLGRNDFDHIGQTLFQELIHFKVLEDEQTWNRLQVSFLESHQFFTPTNINRRSPIKADHLRQLKVIVATYEKK